MLRKIAISPESINYCDPDAAENVTLTVSLNQARTILAALDRRCDDLHLAVLAKGGCPELLAEVKATYQSIDRQVFQAK